MNMSARQGRSIAARQCRGLTADNAEQRQNVAALSVVVSARLAAMAQGRGTNSVRDFGIDRSHGRHRERLLAARQAATTKVRETTLVSLLATLAVACGVFAALFAESAAKCSPDRRSESDLREANRFLRIRSSRICR